MLPPKLPRLLAPARASLSKVPMTPRVWAPRLATKMRTSRCAQCHLSIILPHSNHVFKLYLRTSFSHLRPFDFLAQPTVRSFLFYVHEFM